MRIPLDAKVITLYKDRGIWFALFGGPEADDIRKLFGTTAIPTPFTDDVSDNRVLNAIQKLNPAYTVLLEFEEPKTPLVHPEGWQSDGSVNEVRDSV